MNLKESFQYKNRLTQLLSSAQMFLQSSANITTRTQEHQRTKSKPDAQDETVVVVSADASPYSGTQMLFFALALMKESEDLTVAIAAAKSLMAEDYDSLVAVNARRRSFLATLNSISHVRPREYMTKGMDYAFNAEGNQVSYTYPMKEIITPTIDAALVKGMIKQTTEQAEKTSTELDKLLVNTPVLFTPTFSMNDSLEDAIESFLAMSEKSEGASINATPV